ncbi:branched-chain amino acid ABC transporter permease [Ramlibacter sp.]|uniref:branched-chain amino acid ABC transporter permease n=1 Tax=Ramlibacter sp. TaxID=1917967 RepID=UPI003D09DF3E
MTSPSTTASDSLRSPSAAEPKSARLSPAVRNTYLALLVLGLAAPMLGVYPVFAMKLLCFALFACAFNLLLGFTGLLSFGHAAFFGFSAYIAGWLIKAQGLTPELGMLAGTLCGALLGLVFGLVAIRRQGIYFAMITLALAQMVFFICLQAKFTGGEDGLQGVPRGSLFGVLPLASDLTLYYVVLAIFVACFLGILRIVGSPFGQVLKMIRENEPRAVSLGYEVDKYKLLAFVLSAGLSGLAGSLKTVIMGFATLSDVHWSMSGEVILMSLLGGVGTFFGPVLGAGVVIGLQNLLADKAGEWVTVIIGAIFVLCVLAFRKGIVGELLAWRERRQVRS